MDYSIIIPVFNREDLTRRCLELLPASIDGAGTGEVIVVDNGSAPATAEVLAAFPWIRVIRNETNLGFAVACNQGARAATGRILVHLNNDTEPLAGWLPPMLRLLDDPQIGTVGAKLLFPDDTLQHAGVLCWSARFGPEGFGPFHTLMKQPQDHPGANERRDFEIVTGACLVTPRALFAELGGFDEAYWNGYEDVDYCLKVRARGLRVVYEPAAVLYHLESQSGIQRKRRVSHNIRELAERWRDVVDPDVNRHCDLYRGVRREVVQDGQAMAAFVALPPLSILVHGDAPADPAAFAAMLRAAKYPIARIVWAAGGMPPPGTEPAPDAVAAARELTEVRGDRYVVFVETSTQVGEMWLNDLVDAVEFGSDVCAATVVPPPYGAPVSPLGADARCTIVAPSRLPQHLRISAERTTLHGALAEWIGSGVASGRGVRIARRFDGQVAPAVAPDAAFEGIHGLPIEHYCAPDPVRLEALMQPRAFAPFASIVMLSWNAPEYTELAVRSIREHTRAPYEIIIVDNGSHPETVARLLAIDDIRLIQNAENTGFAHGCNQGIAAARGTHVVILNNDVVVTDGWLENLLEAHRRNPLVGISAPRSNRIAGNQQLSTANYPGLEEMHRFAAERARTHRGQVYETDRAIGFCLCIAREVIDEVGGFDERFGLGNFEDDDLSIRVRAAGYLIVVCEDVFIHHFGSVSFATNNVDYRAQMHANWAIFARRWGLSPEYPVNGYDLRPLIARGFDRRTDRAPLPADRSATPALTVPERRADGARYETVFCAIVDDEAGWGRLAPSITNYARALSLDDRTVFAIAATGSLGATEIGRRVERALAKRSLGVAACPDIDIADVDELDAWIASLDADRAVRIDADARLGHLRPLGDRSPSGFARFVRALVAG